MLFAATTTASTAPAPSASPAAGGFQLPSNLGHATIHTGTGLISLAVSASNVVFGVIGFGILLVGIYKILTIFWHSWRGSDGVKHNASFLSVNSKSPALSAIIDILAGMVLIGIILSGAWVNIVNGMLGVSQHVGNVISSHIGGG